MVKKIKTSEAVSVINALNGGVVPSVGLQHILVGRQKEIEAIIQSLEDVAAGHSLVRFWIGEFGSGKSFILHLIKSMAFRKNFVVASADFNPELRLYANDRKAVNLYSKLLRSLATETSPQGGALETIFSQWIEKFLEKTAQEKNLQRDFFLRPENIESIREPLIKSCKEISHHGSHDFGQVLFSYLKGFVSADEQLRQQALKWFYGEQTSLTEARQTLEVRRIIDDENYYDMLKNLTAFFKTIGYSGLVINLDEAVNLYKISQSPSREKNYEKLLTIYNDCFQGANSGMFFNIGGTEDFLKDERRGLFSYDALKTRLMGNNFETEGLQDYNQPVIKLRPLNHDEIFKLLLNVKTVFDARHQTSIDITEADVEKFVNSLLNRPGAEDFLTPRESTKKFISLLNLLQQHPEEKEKLLSQIKESSPQAETEDSVEII